MAGNMNGDALTVNPPHAQVCPSSHLRTGSRIGVAIDDFVARIPESDWEKVAKELFL